MNYPDCTLVTACFSMAKYNKHCRTLEESINNMKSLLETPCFLVIYTDPELYNYIKDYRDKYNLNHITKYIVKDFSELKVFSYRDIVKKNREKYHPTKDIRTCIESHLICCSKFDFVLETIETNPFNTNKFGWIDGSTGINFSKICINYSNNMLLKILDNCSEKFHIQILNVVDKKYVLPEFLQEYYSKYRYVVCGSFFTTGKDIGNKVLNTLNNIFVSTTLTGYGHGEEMFYLEALLKHPNDIVKSYGDYCHILNNFLSTTVGFQYITKVIESYNLLNYHNECYECCEKVIKDIEIMKNVNNFDYCSYFKLLYYSYISSYYFDRSVSLNCYKKIMQLIDTNERIKNEYLKNKQFFDNNFAYILS